MPKIREVRTVFIASPSDVAEERKKAFEVVADLDKLFKKNGLSIDLLGWEERLPGYGRPQAQINQDVDACDLFIGVLWRRWGTPPGISSTYSSGFEEEFSLALARRERISSPDIWMYFKEVDSEQLADPGPELRRVIDFKKSLIEGKLVLFSKFIDLADWERILRDALSAYLLNFINVEQSRAPDAPPKQSIAPPVESTNGRISAGATGAASQLAELSDVLSPLRDTGTFSAMARSIPERETYRFWAVRSLLLSAGLVSESCSWGTPIPVHELNTLYRFRARIQASDTEKSVLLATILADGTNVKPGWFWFRDWTPAAVSSLLAIEAMFGNDVNSQRKSFEILRRAKTPLRSIDGASLILDINWIAPEVEDAAWAYLVDAASIADLGALSASELAPWLGSRIEWLQNWIHDQRELDAFLPRGLDFQLMPEPIKQQVIERIPSLSTDSLQALEFCPDLRLSSPATLEVKHRAEAKGKLSTDLREPQTAGKLMSLSSTFGEVESAEEEPYERLRQMQSSDLRRQLFWYDLDSPTAYRLLIERGEVARQDARSNLLNRFESFRKDSLDRLAMEQGAKVAAKMVEKFEQYDSLFTRMFTEAVLSAVERDPEAEDVNMARQLIDDYRTRPVATRIIARVAGPSDIDLLIELAVRAHGDEKNLVLETLGKLAAGDRIAARILLGSKSHDVRRVGLNVVDGLPPEQAITELRELLLDPEEHLRFETVLRLRDRLTSAQLESLLNEYISQDTYFYNVATWIDRILYAKGVALAYYEEEEGLIGR